MSKLLENYVYFWENGYEGATSTQLPKKAILLKTQQINRYKDQDTSIKQSPLTKYFNRTVTLVGKHRFNTRDMGHGWKIKPIPTTSGCTPVVA